jgi:redox-sensitive bicupin YhaK (pirin superfamily)
VLTLRRSGERGRTRLSWLDSRHSFSFGSYVDPAHTGFRALRVLNDDVVAPGAGFGPHPHRDAEILTLVLEGALEHRDSEGFEGVLRAGDVQRMTAGKGIVHSETNASRDEPVHFLQIWFETNRPGRAPGYEEKPGALEGAPGRMHALAEPEGRGDALTLYQDARLLAGRFAAGDEHTAEIAPGRHGWLHLIEGRVRSGDDVLEAGDAAAVSDAPRLSLRFEEGSRILFFDLA